MGKQRMMCATASALCLLMTCVPVTGQAVTTWGRIFHTAVTKQANAVAELIMVTRDPQSSVTITLSVAAVESTHNRIVQPNEPAKFEIPAALLTTQSTVTDWKKEQKGIKIEADADIGVRLVTRSTVGTGTGAITVLPDSACGTEYRVASPSTNTEALSDDILIFPAGTSTTEIRWTWNGYDTTDLTVNGAAASATEQVVNLGENEVLHLVCGSPSYELRLTSNNPIAVIAGKEDNKIRDEDTLKGRVLIQNIPSMYAGTDFVLFGQETVNYVGETFFINPINAVAGTTDTKCHFRTTSQLNCNDNDHIFVNTGGLHIKATNPILLYGSFIGHGLIKPSSLNVPNVNQYTTLQAIYLEEGYRYLILVTGTSIAGISVHVEDNISIRFTGVTLCSDPQYAARTRQVTKQGTSPIQYEVYSNSEDFVVEDTDMANSNEGGMVTFRANEVNEPFLVVVVEINSFDEASAATAFGVKFVPTFNVATCTPPVSMAPNDGKDNDCDGRVDEELDNNEDDDGDGVADEDLASDVQIRRACLLEDVDNTVRTPTGCSIAKDATVTYTCVPGYAHSGGNLVRTCGTSDVVLSGTKPSCIAPAPDYVSL